jgi:sterol 3beta-glucosyltransferase
MKLTVIGMGTRGDAQPAIALGKALKAAGYQVRILASKGFESWIESHGLEVAPSHIDIHEMMSSEGGKQWVDSGNNAVRELQAMRGLMNDVGGVMARDVWEACHDADAVIASFTTDPAALSSVQKRPIPLIRTMLQPLNPTRNGACFPNLPFPNSKNWINLQISHFARGLLWSVHEQATNKFRQEVLNLPPLTSKTFYQALDVLPLLHGFSEHVIPRAEEWGANVHTTGYWFLDEDEQWQPSAALLDFLNAGAPPVCIGFGSMTGRNPEQTSAIVLEAIKLSGQRVILLSGWAGVGLKDLPKDIFQLKSAPHGWLFPRTAAVVHHGGAGTTAAGLRAGVPSIVVPHFSDQPLWGERVKALGVGPKPILRSKLTAERLAKAIREAVEDEGIKRRAAELGAKIRAEDGVGNAVKLIQRYFG